MPSKVAQVLASHIPSIKSLHSDSTSNLIENTKGDKKIAEKLGLTEREVEISVMISQGFSNRQIASALYITDGTVKNYVSSIYSKTKINDRTKLALYVKENGIK